jgi:alginate O-acetyltransferase complex protein AlgI
MALSSLTFLLVFLPVCLLLYCGVPQKMRNLLLFVIGIVFYAWGEPWFLWLFLIWLLANYLLGLGIEKFRGKPKKSACFLWAGILWNIGILLLFGRGVSLTEQMGVLPAFGEVGFRFLLPMGFSVGTLQAISYLVDLFRGEIKVQRNPVALSLGIALFPQLAAGPVVRYREMEPQLFSRKSDTEALSAGIGLFIKGLGKKILLADHMGLVWERVQEISPGNLSQLGAWIGLAAFALQLYYTLSGCCDMAVGTARMFGFQLPRGFEAPYAALNLRDFWNRFFRPLTAWFGHYVFSPLAGEDGNSLRRAGAIFVSWLAASLWYGGGKNLLPWGIFMGLLLILEEFMWGRYLQKAPALLRRGYTVLFVLLGWTFFARETPAEAWEYFLILCGRGGKFYSNADVYILLSNSVWFLLCILGCGEWHRKFRDLLSRKVPGIYQFSRTAVLLVLLFLCISYLATAEYQPLFYL